MTFSEYKEQLSEIYKPFRELGIEIPTGLANDLFNQADELLFWGHKQGFDIARAQEDLLDDTLGALLEHGYVSAQLAELILKHYPALVFHLNYETVKGQLNISLAEVGFNARLRNINAKSAKTLSSYVFGMPENPSPDYVVQKCIDSLNYIVSNERDGHYFSFMNKDYISDFYMKGFSLLEKCSPEMRDKFFGCMPKVLDFYEDDDIAVFIDPKFLLAWLSHESIITIADKFDLVGFNHYAADFPLSDLIVKSKIVLPQGFWERNFDRGHLSSSITLLMLALCEYLDKPDSNVDPDAVCNKLASRISSLLHGKSAHDLNNETLNIINHYLQTQGVKNKDRIKQVVLGLAKHCAKYEPEGLSLRVINKLGLDDEYVIYSETSRMFLVDDMGL
jgi:hypothetical protein